MHVESTLIQDLAYLKNPYKVHFEQSHSSIIVPNRKIVEGIQASAHGLVTLRYSLPVFIVQFFSKFHPSKLFSDSISTNRIPDDYPCAPKLPAVRSVQSISVLPLGM